MDKENQGQPRKRHTDWGLWVEEVWDKTFEALFPAPQQVAPATGQPGYFETKGPTGYERLQG